MSDVICHHCHKPIESKSDLLVMIKWWLLPRPLHKQCWGDLFLSKGGAGTISFGTGVFQSRKRRFFAVNSIMFTLIAAIALLVAVFLLFFFDPAQGMVSVNGVAREPTVIEGILIKLLLPLVFLVPLGQRLWSYSAYESKLPA